MTSRATSPSYTVRLGYQELGSFRSSNEMFGLVSLAEFGGG